MAVLTREDLLNAVKARIGDDTSDEAIKFVEDVSDTLADMAEKSKEDWKTKYEENDAAWRQKYRNRFFGEETVPVEPTTTEEAEDYSYDSLFEEVKE